MHILYRLVAWKRARVACTGGLAAHRARGVCYYPAWHCTQQKGNSPKSALSLCCGAFVFYTDSSLILSLANMATDSRLYCICCFELLWFSYTFSYTWSYTWWYIRGIVQFQSGPLRPNYCTQKTLFIELGLPVVNWSGFHGNIFEAMNMWIRHIWDSMTAVDVVWTEFIAHCHRCDA